MKTIKLLILFGLINTAYCAETFVGRDFRNEKDMTGYSQISPSMLNWAWYYGHPETNVGFILVQTNSPNVTNDSRYTNYLWMDTRYSPPVVRYYIRPQYASNINDTTNWNLVGVNDGSIIASKIADFNITAQKLATNAVQTYSLSNRAVTFPKIDLYAVHGTSNMMASSIEGDRVVWPFLTNVSMYNFTVLTQAIAVSNLDASFILNSSMQGSNKITMNSIDGGTNGQIRSNSIAGDIIKLATITGNNIAANTVSNRSIAPGAIHATNVGYATIQSTNLALSGISVYVHCSGSIASVVGGGGASTVNPNFGISAVNYTSPNLTITASNAFDTVNYHYMIQCISMKNIFFQHGSVSGSSYVANSFRGYDSADQDIAGYAITFAVVGYRKVP